MRTLTLPLKREYFEQIRNGEKTEEYRLVTPFWRKRLEARSYDKIVFTLGYPKTDDVNRRIECKWAGCKIKTIQHKHFGNDPVLVYAIKVAK